MAIFAAFAANALADQVRVATAEAQLGNPDTTATITRAAIWVFAIAVAANQVGVAGTLVDTPVMGTVRAVGAGTGLGLRPGRPRHAGQIVHNRYNRSRYGARRVREAATNLAQQTGVAVTKRPNGSGETQRPYVESGNGGGIKKAPSVCSAWFGPTRKPGLKRSGYDDE